MYLSLKSFLINYKYLILIFLALSYIIYLLIDIIRNKKNNTNKKQNIRDMVTISIFSALSIIFYLTFKFSLPIFPEFLKINFSNLAVILGAFLLGRKNGISIVFIRTIIVLPFSQTFFVGELADLIISISIVIVGTYIYNLNKTKKGAIISLVCISLTWIIISAFANYFILIPAYIELIFDGNEQVFLGMLKIIPDIALENYKWKYILFAALPFNALISISVCFITFFTYKKLSILFHKFDE